ncbi:ABC transporter substrate-binding protein [Microbacterium sp.]|uniref:ABC transporter substrate-binding protein n=1 Tax=Microbacterium sp. TaxID=51671 RepID=UPI003A8C07D8
MNLSRRSLRALLAVTTVGTVAVLAACSGTSEAGSTGSPSSSSEAGVIEVPGATAEANAYMNELYDAAMAAGEDQIVMYGPSPSANKAMDEVFTARFPGITIVPQDQPDAQILTKIETEAASGNRIADFYLGGDAPQAAAQPDLCTIADVRTGPEGFEIPTAYDGRLTYFALRYFGFVYNTDKVSADEAPKNWHDLLDPKWKGEITVGDMTVPSGVRYILTQLMLPETEDTWGKDYLTALAAQDLQIAQSEPTVPADVASGRFSIGIGVFQGYFQAQKDKGAPIEFIFPLDDGGNFMSRSAMCLVNEAPHSNAAQLYVNWIYSPEGQLALAEKNESYGWTPEAPGPASLPALNEFERLPFSNPDPEFNRPYFEFIAETFKKN